MNWEVYAEYDSGARLCIGDTQEPGIHLKFTSPWGYERTTVSGTKPQFGRGGFEFGVDAAASYILTIENEEHEIQTIDGLTKLLLTRVDSEQSWIPAEVSGRKVTSRGVHGPPFGQHGSWAPEILVWCELWVRMNLSWILLTCDGDDIFIPRPCWEGTELEGKSTAEVLLDHGIIPIWRVNLLYLPTIYKDWAHLDMAVPIYNSYGINRVPIKPWNEWGLANEWVDKKVPQNAQEIYSGLFNGFAREAYNRGGIPIRADKPNEDNDWMVFHEPIFDLWEMGMVIDGLHNYGHNKPPLYPSVPAVVNGKPLERWRFNWMLGPMINDPDWNQWGLQEINFYRAEMQGEPSKPDNSCYRDWENHAGVMERHFGKVLPMAMCEGGWGPGDRLDPRWPRCGIEQVFWYTNEIFNDDSPLIWKCPWLIASSAMGGIGWEDKTWVGGEFTEWYGFEKPVAVGLKCSGYTKTF